jgi:hypothetical protein
MTKKSTTKTVVQKASTKNSWNKLRKTIPQIINQQKVKELQKDVQNLVKSAQSDIKKNMPKDMNEFKARVAQEAKVLEQTVNMVVGPELKKAKAFLQKHQKDLDKVQKTVESYLPHRPNLKNLLSRATKKTR